MQRLMPEIVSQARSILPDRDKVQIDERFRSLDLLSVNCISWFSSFPPHVEWFFIQLLVETGRTMKYRLDEQNIVWMRILFPICRDRIDVSWIHRCVRQI
jgi:hypothetical protein